MLSFAEENYLKSIYHLSNGGIRSVSTNAIAESLKTKPASVSDMLRKLNKKGVITYEKYKGVNISKSGKKQALSIIRKHRLWEVFLVEKLNFNWDEVHEIAEQLEHIRSSLLITRLDEFLGYPQYDPHGDPIPDEHGMVHSNPKTSLTKLEIDHAGILVSIKDTSDLFLQYLDKVGISIGSKIKVLDIFPYDGSREILINGKNKLSISQEVSENLLMTQ
jgi:DtxR family Mn-dependent transcriptional regulator